MQLGIRFSCEFEGTSFDFYRHLRSCNPSPYMFYFEFEDRVIFGASPEFLVRLDGRRARIRPLAGTRARGETAERAIVEIAVATSCWPTKKNGPSMSCWSISGATT